MTQRKRYESTKERKRETERKRGGKEREREREKKKKETGGEKSHFFVSFLLPFP